MSEPTKPVFGNAPASGSPQRGSATFASDAQVSWDFLYNQWPQLQLLPPWVTWATDKVDVAALDADIITGAKDQVVAAEAVVLAARDQSQGHANRAALEAANAAANSSGQNFAGMVAQALPMTVLGLHIPDTLYWQLWMTSKTASLANEARSTGPEIGSAANATAAWALPNAAAGCVVYDTTAAVYRELTTSNAWKTTTRAGSQSFPPMRAVSRETSRVIIHDISGQKPTMWRVHALTGLTVTSVVMLGHVLVIGTTTGAIIMDYAADMLTPTVTHSTATTPAIVNNTVNAVAITVLPDALLDLKARLPVPTIPVGTAGGLSVIRHDELVSDSASTTAVVSVAVTDEGVWWSTATTLLFATWADVYSGDGFGDVVGSTTAGAEEIDLYTAPTYLAAADGQIIVSGASGKQIIIPNYDDLTKSISHVVTKDYATGVMVGDIRGCFLTGQGDDTDLVGANVYTSDFSSTVDGFVSAGGSTTLAATGGRLRITNTADGGSLAYRSFSVVAGKRYCLRLNFAADTVTGNSFAYLGTSVGGTQVLNQNLASTLGERVIYFTATASTVYLTFGTSSAALTGEYTEWDEIALDLADPDRSVKGKGPIINGTITKTPEANSDFMWYSGFSASNYLEQPYNADLDFGTGAFSWYGWIKEAANSGVETVLERDSDTSAQRYTLGITAAGLLTWTVDDNTTVRTATSAAAIDDGQPRMVIADYDGVGSVRLRINGEFSDIETGSALLTLNNTSALLRLGLAINGTNPLINGSLAMWRPSATLITPEQGREIYHIEDAMRRGYFLLGGTSNAVLDIAYDWSNRQLRVLTSSGISVFDMDTWRRIEFIAGSWTKLAANNGMDWRQ